MRPCFGVLLGGQGCQNRRVVLAYLPMYMYMYLSHMTLRVIDTDIHLT